MHVSFVFDDGFIKSCHQVADLFEERGLRATFAVLVDHEGFMVDYPKGDFALWNKLQERGHEIHPHGWDHSDLSKLPFEEATQKIDDCLAYFSDNLKDFDASKTIYHLTYNRSTPMIDNYLRDRVRAIRTSGPAGEPSDGINKVEALKARKFGCTWHGPDYCDTHLNEQLKAAEATNDPHFCYMLHGLDGEGWGPIHKDALSNTLDVIQTWPRLTYTPIGEFASTHLD